MIELCKQKPSRFSVSPGYIKTRWSTLYGSILNYSDRGDSKAEVLVLARKHIEELEGGDGSYGRES